MVQSEIHERFGLPRERLPVIYNAIDPAVFNPGLQSLRGEVRAQYGIADDACVFTRLPPRLSRRDRAV